MLTISQEILITVLLGILLFLVLSIVVTLLIFRYKTNQQKHFVEIKNIKAEFDQQLLQAQMEVQEHTFSALGKELHDNVGQLLSTTKMLLGISERTMTVVPDTLATANATLGKAIQELRALSRSLTKEWLEQFDLLDNLRVEVGRINSSSAIQVNFKETPKISFLRSDEQIILFRIVQEAIQNTIKHANAQNLDIMISCTESELRIVVQDDGIGFEEKEGPSGIGLMNMRHRIKVLGGKIEWVSAPGKGTRVTIEMPLQQQSI